MGNLGFYGFSKKSQPVVATGGIESDIYNWRIHKFLASGFLIVYQPIYVDYLLVAGGGGGGASRGGGGGAGGIIFENAYLTEKIYSITVGNGASMINDSAGGVGGNSIFNNLVFKSP